MTLVGDGVLAVAEGVPQLDRPVAGTRDDLTIVGGEGDRQDIVGVADEGAGGLAGRELPEAEGLIPRAGERIGAIGGDDLQYKPSAEVPPPILQPIGWFRHPLRFQSLQSLAMRGRHTQSDTMWEWPWRLRLG